MEFDKDVPLPESKYEFVTRLEIGDSKYIPFENTRGSFYKCARLKAIKSGIKIIGRKEHGGLRIWRIEWIICILFKLESMKWKNYY